MDSKTSWGLKRKEEENLRDWQRHRKALVDRKEVDPCPLQPISGDWGYFVTLPLLDQSQVGARVFPLSFAVGAINIVGIRTGHPLMKLASTEDIQAFLDDQSARRAAHRVEKNRLENRTMVNVVAPVPPTTREAV
jgi:hypothetical protein